MLHQQVRDIFARSIALKQQMMEGGHLDILVPMAQRMLKAVKEGNKILFCGNGGSAGDAQHLAAELLIRLRSHVDRPSLPALTLAMDPSTLTASGNDYSFDEIFARPLSGLGKAGDVLVGLTTSGKSPNVLRAFETARSMGIVTMGMLGGRGEPALSLCDYAFVVPSHETARIQESHITAGHALMEMLEDLWLADRENAC